MIDSIFTVGEPQFIEDVINNKDKRVALQQQLMSQYLEYTVVAVKLNIPGPIKNNQYLEKLFALVYKDFKQTIPKIIDEINWNINTGNEAFLIVDENARTIKQLAIEFENYATLGRLFDIDVMSHQSGHLSRSNFDMEPRKCLICGRPAKECARSRRHSVAELQAKISCLYAENIDGDI
ncbi:citrate lyase holo-[acyl-carrier protein] synthase [Paucilactobacillus kaifaensis]|uniref:citrate lyase holo-[acyl-carrier protein] synthase n=1 Tax=Paucilactobacillus kaifaensis TaxID=2559921 RepID=UPI0010F7CEBA|nr:citrate lyase holo-[acyl-carrier protein] synthase [Paucilactobacillus kaifaensis]